MKKYFPILLLKSGEIDALKKLVQAVKDGTTPIIEVTYAEASKLPKLFKEWGFQGNSLFLDFSYYQNITTENADIYFSQAQIEDVNVVPVIQENSNNHYFDFVHELLHEREYPEVCFRFSERSGGLDNIDNRILSLCQRLNVTKDRVSILIDVAYLEERNHIAIEHTAITTLTAISRKNEYNNIILASGSFPKDLSRLEPIDTPYLLTRYEKGLWNQVSAREDLRGLIKYSDYGTKNPIFEPSNFPGTSSIKYTTTNRFLIYRGVLPGNHDLGNGQYVVFSRSLILRAEYSGSGYSWGDERINQISQCDLTADKYKCGAALTWVSISQNHHITFIYNSL